MFDQNQPHPLDEPAAMMEGDGLDPRVVEWMFDKGIYSIRDVGECTREELKTIPGIGDKVVDNIQLAFVSYCNRNGVRIE